jgi:hypothetical protein
MVAYGSLSIGDTLEGGVDPSCWFCGCSLDDIVAAVASGLVGDPVCCEPGAFA